MVTDAYIALAVGAFFSLLYVERTGILPAGIVVPSYLALTFTSPMIIVGTLFIAFITYLFVMKVIGRFTVLYGRRKFTAMLLCGIIFKIIFDQFVNIPTTLGMIELQVLGMVVPGIIANTIQRQGVIPTVSSTVLLSALTYSVLLTYNSIV
ncbi:poly-gamma-glutamate biosynthesis protein PgsC [Oceanobacillus senegalensis]|uniref:poly-gamma-glutamate biosynthesis protein PgsC n=1 Tax=Oceanobacillus senegalensis TaxID=1936063 RepID=UPI000A30C569|nr:poly-gamma-glutamate biosynthesis protein PgsC [Oceanobacillus senegalensis]